MSNERHLDVHDEDANTIQLAMDGGELDACWCGVGGGGVGGVGGVDVVVDAVVDALDTLDILDTLWMPLSTHIPT